VPVHCTSTYISMCSARASHCVGGFEGCCYGLIVICRSCSLALSGITMMPTLGSCCWFMGQQAHQVMVICYLHILNIWVKLAIELQLCQQVCSRPVGCS
jgi:hypothetical protein